MSNFGRDKEKTVSDLQEKVKALELIGERNAQLTKRVGLLESEKVRLERACAVQESKFEFSELLVQLWQNMCERGVNTITQFEHEKNVRPFVQHVRTSPSAPSYATMRLILSIREQLLLDANEQLERERETQAYEVFDAAHAIGETSRPSEK